MRDDTIAEYLHRLADRVPAPGGGCAAALHAAQGAALIAMVGRYSTGPKYAEAADTVTAVTARADELRERAVAQAEADAEAFTAVTEAFGLPNDTDSARETRSATIAAAMLDAALPPGAVIETAAAIVALAERLLPVANRNLITDIAVAAESARAAAASARVNIEVNLAGVRDETAAAELTALAGTVDALAVRAAALTDAVREELRA